MKKNEELLASEPVGKLLFRLAAPTVAAQIINMLYNVVDRIYIGRIPEVGARALTGVGVCMPLIMIVSAFAALISGGGAPRASVFIGGNDKASAEKTLGNCFSLQIAAAAAITAALLIWNKPLLMAFGASVKTIPYALSYMNIYAVGTIFVQLTLGMNAFITAQGFAKTGMLSVLIGALLNIILDPVFIFGFKMGVRGAALATVISQSASCLWTICFLTGKKTILRLARRNFRLDSKIIFPSLALGLAAFVMQASESFISVCFNSSLQRYGGDMAVGAMTILVSVAQFALIPLQGLGQGAQPIVGFNYGAGDAGRVGKSFGLLLKICLCYSFALWLAVMLFPKIFVRAFSSDAELIEFASVALRIYIAGLGVFGIQIACQTTFTALGMAKASIAVAVARKFALLLPLIYVLPRIFPDNQTLAVYCAEPVADVAAVTFTAALFAFKFKRVIKEIKK